ncbi:ABC transporter ATP-binding protein [Anatilimnocola floriformis]|uniref:ABC transporter ATP-binding protein n=1 Tax=Anatilimnocola floriformis TaxID=2948575 RepID=UPI0020C3869E|nr:oligopeptide/dipeptide ABC transporter ATP-binding protein [Anatilimnocola floriformis]
MSTATIAEPVTSKAKVGKPLLEVKNLKVHFPTRKGGWFGKPGLLRAVDGVSFTIHEGETLGLVGESGCGKTTTARAAIHLQKPTSGEIWLGGTRIDSLSAGQMQPHRKQIQMIFQDPFASLNPRMTVGRIIQEPMEIFGLHGNHRKLEAMRLMDLVGLNPRFLNRYPHEFSGGQRQRIGIARALAVQPKLIVCDEPVSALDVSIQAQVINLLMDLQRQLGLAYLFISHDLSVVRHISHRIGVMYLGRIVELATADALHARPRHPYTQALLSAAPIPDPVLQRERKRIILQGEVPSADRVYPGCPFADRCPIAEGRCREVVPLLEGRQHLVACIKAPAE